MAIAMRIARLFKADIHGILDCIEDPHSILKQSIRDMEVEIENMEKSIASIDSSLGCLLKQEHRLANEIDEVAGQITLSFKSENDELARRFVRKKLELEAQKKRVGSSIESVRHKKQHVDEIHNAYINKLKEIKSKADTFAEFDGIQDWTGDVKRYVDTVSDCDVEITFIEQKERWLQAKNSVVSDSSKNATQGG